MTTPGLDSSGGTLAGGGGGAVPIRFSRIHLPRRTGEVRSAREVDIRTPPLPSSPRRISNSGPSVTRRNRLPYT